MRIDFKFEVGDKVTTAMGHRGIVQICGWDGGQNVYCIETIDERRFHPGAQLKVGWPDHRWIDKSTSSDG